MKKQTIILPTAKKILAIVGENIKLARKRRRWTMENMSERANISRPTLYFIEKGSPKVAIGKYLNVVSALKMGNDFLAIAGNDSFGRILQDADTLNRKHQPNYLP